MLTKAASVVSQRQTVGLSKLTWEVQLQRPCTHHTLQWIVGCSMGIKCIVSRYSNKRTGLNKRIL